MSVLQMNFVRGEDSIRRINDALAGMCLSDVRIRDSRGCLATRKDFDENGQVKEEVRAAQERGVLMDDSHGRMLWSFDHLKKAVACGFMPDIISSDVVHPCEYMPPACNLLYAMNVDLAAGMQASDIFQAVTFNPAKALGLSDRAGVIEEGRNADVCVMKLADCDRTYQDWWGGSCTARKVFVPVMTLVDGEIVYRQTWV